MFRLAVASCLLLTATASGQDLDAERAPSHTTPQTARWEQPAPPRPLAPEVVVLPPLPIPEGMEEIERGAERWLWQLHAVLGRAKRDDFDRSLRARNYGPSEMIVGAETSLLRVLTKNIAIGGRLGVRGRRWQHFDLDAATMFGADAQLLIDARYSFEHVGLGLAAAGGLGLAAAQLNEVSELRATWRVALEGFLYIEVVGPLRVVARAGYDFFPADFGPNLTAHLGGFRFGLGFEVRE